ncbi:MAG TPA: hypothetical protein VFV00_01080 [Acidimicrobiales bacterium]|nr:hypothetical protein [Acidimicrobiales bacterium]
MRARMIIGVVLIAIGLVWFFQGIGVLKGSFMTGEALWAVIGVIAVFLGGSLVRGTRRN